MSLKIKKIVIATDGSENAKNAIEWGIGLAKNNKAMVTALYVIPNPGVTLAMRGETWVKGLHTHLKEEGNKALQEVVEAGKEEDVKVDTIIIDDKNPSDGIVDFASENDVDLIVMGTKGRTGLNHILVGSVAENVVRHAKRQVLIVP